jgi:subtilisin family serine protease
VSGDDDPYFDMRWGLDAIDVPEAWAAGARCAGARVAILDTGIDIDHPDVAPNLESTRSTATGESTPRGQSARNESG